MASGTVDVVYSKNCSKMFSGTSSRNFAARNLRSGEPPSPVSSSNKRPFSGLVICVTGLSKEARKQVMEATERLGGQYSSDLHPHCTHLVAQSFVGRKFEHALKHGKDNGLFVVSLGWFVDCVRQNVRLNESLYSVKTLHCASPREQIKQSVPFSGSEKSCFPQDVFDKMESPRINTHINAQTLAKGFSSNCGPVLGGAFIFVDPDVSSQLQDKVLEAASSEGAMVLDTWFMGCKATHVVCEEKSLNRYIGYTSNLVTPIWILKTVKERRMQRLVSFSSDLAREIASVLDLVQSNLLQANTILGVQGGRPCGELLSDKDIQVSVGFRQQKVDSIKMDIRGRRSQIQMQTCTTNIRPLTPASLLDSICWSISEPAANACMYLDSEGTDDASECASSFFDAQGDAITSEEARENLSRPLKEREKRALIFKGAFLTILFPIDRYDEIGPSSRTYFSQSGFTCLQVLDQVYSFYQENMSFEEIELAIHTDSRYADRLRSTYASRVSVENGFVDFKRIDLLGSRRNFELLKRCGENGSHVYELRLGS